MRTPSRFSFLLIRVPTRRVHSLVDGKNQVLMERSSFSQSTLLATHAQSSGNGPLTLDRCIFVQTSASSLRRLRSVQASARTVVSVRMELAPVERASKVPTASTKT